MMTTLTYGSQISFTLRVKLSSLSCSEGVRGNSRLMMVLLFLAVSKR